MFGIMEVVEMPEKLPLMIDLDVPCNHCKKNVHIPQSIIMDYLEKSIRIYESVYGSELQLNRKTP